MMGNSLIAYVAQHLVKKKKELLANKNINYQALQA